MRLLLASTFVPDAPIDLNYSPVRLKKQTSVWGE